MARNIDDIFRGKVLNFLKSEWFKNGQQQFPATMEQIAIGIGEDPKNKREKVWNYLDMLERGGHIKIIKGKGSQSNEYIFLNENIKHEIDNIKEKVNFIKENYIIEQNNIMQKVLNDMEFTSTEILNLTGQMIHYKSVLLDLEPFGTGPEGRQILMAKKGSTILAMIEQLKMEQNKNS
jgi:hypothetical protein